MVKNRNNQAIIICVKLGLHHMKKLILSFILLFLPYFAHAADWLGKYKIDKNVPSEKAIYVDRYASMYAGASLFLSIRSLISEGKSYLLPQKIKENLWLNVGIGIGEIFLIDFPMMWAYTQVFGYGFRIRSLVGDSVNTYQSLGFQNFYPNSPTDYAYDIPILISAAPYEASKVLWQELYFKIIQKKHQPGSFLILIHATAAQFFILEPINKKTKFGKKDSKSNFLNYLYYLNTKHPGKEKLSVQDFQIATILAQISNLFMPIGMWLLNKEDKTDYNIPGSQRNGGIKLGSIRYIFLCFQQNTPFGIGYSLRNYIVFQEKVFLLSLNLGKSPFYTNCYGGIGVKTDTLYTYRDYTLDLETQLWYQPKLLLQKTDVLEDKNCMGYLVGAYNKYKINPHFSLYGAFLYKTRGYLEGIVAEDGFIWQVGLAVSYNIDLDHFG